MSMEEMELYDRIYCMCINHAMEIGRMPDILEITFFDYFKLSKIMKTALNNLGLQIILSPSPYVLKVGYYN